jgi:hypothetical protein
MSAAPVTTNGYLYCITNPEYEKEGIYKCGFTTKGETLDEAKKKLCTRYGTTWISVILHHVEPVSTPKEAEEKWFNSMKESRLKKTEFFQLPLSTILEHVKEVALSYPPSKNSLTELQKIKYINACQKVCNALEKHKYLPHGYLNLLQQYQKYELDCVCTTFYSSTNMPTSKLYKGYIWTNVQMYFNAWLNGNERDKEFVHVFSKTK